jgi:hypothetical protein
MGREEPGDSHPTINELEGAWVVPSKDLAVPEPDVGNLHIHMSLELSLILACLSITLNDWCMLNHPCIPEMKPAWSWCWYSVEFSLPLFYWGFLHLCSLKRLTCNPLFCCVLFWFWDECNTGFIELVWQCCFPFYFVEKFKECLQ